MSTTDSTFTFRTGLTDEGVPYREFTSSLLGLSGIQYADTEVIFYASKHTVELSERTLAKELQTIQNWVMDTIGDG